MGSWVSEDVYGGREEVLASHARDRSVVSYSGHRSGSLVLLRERRRAEEATRFNQRECTGVVMLVGGPDAVVRQGVNDLVTSTRTRAITNVRAETAMPKHVQARPLRRQPPATNCRPSSATPASPSLTHVYSRMRQLMPTVPMIVGSSVPLQERCSVSRGATNMEEGTKTKKTLFVGNIADDVDETVLLETFSTFGQFFRLLSRSTT